MNDEFVPETLRAGSFGEFTVYGVLYKQRDISAETVRVWHLTLLNPGTPEHSDIVRDYWVSGTEFRKVIQARLLEGFTRASTFVLENASTEPPIAEKDAAQMAIATWEAKLRTDATLQTVK